VRHRGGGGRGAGGRGAGRRRMWRWLVGTRGAEEAGAPVGEAMGGGDRGTHRWWGGVRRSRKRRSPAGEAWDGGCSGVRSGGRHGVDRSRWRRRGVRAGGVGLNGRATGGVERVGGTRRVGRAGSIGHAGHVGAHLAQLVGWTIGFR
jgi:hypothetical protein